MGDDSFTKNTNVMSTTTPYDLSTCTIKLTVNSINDPILQVITRSNESVLSSFNLSNGEAEIYSDDTDFYVVGSAPDQDEYVNTVDPGENDLYMDEGGQIQNINGSEIPLEVYNAYAKCGEGGVNFYQKEKEQVCLRKAS